MLLLQSGMMISIYMYYLILAAVLLSLHSLPTSLVALRWVSLLILSICVRSLSCGCPGLFSSAGPLLLSFAPSTFLVASAGPVSLVLLPEGYFSSLCLEVPWLTLVWVHGLFFSLAYLLSLPLTFLVASCSRCPSLSLTPVLRVGVL